MRGYYLPSLTGLSFRLVFRDFILRMDQCKLLFFITEIGRVLFFSFRNIEITDNSDKTYHNPEGFDDKCREIKFVNKGINYQSRSRGVEEGIINIITSDSSKLKQQVCDNYHGNSQVARYVVDVVVHRLLNCK